MKATNSRGLRFVLTGLWLVTMGLRVGPLGAQDLAVERGRVLTVIGRTEAVELRLYPVADAVGLVFGHDVVKPGAEYLRIHFVVDRPGEGWAVHVRKDPAGEIVWSTSEGSTSAGEFWSDEIPGERAIVEVHSSSRSSLLRLRIDKIAVGEPKITAVSITGVNQLRSIRGQEDWIVEAGRSVARLRFVGDDGGVYVCTAFLVTPDLMLTNQHCISSEAERASALVDFDFDEEDVIGRTLRLSELLDADFDLDYAVVRLSEVAGQSPLVLESRRPVDTDQLLIIQHPGGRPKQVSIADCRVDGPLVVGRGGTSTDFGHQCDTLGGSSGSPVFRFGERRVVGLHHLGFRSTSENLLNRAIHVDLILNDMKPAVRTEIETGQQFNRDHGDVLGEEEEPPE